MAAINIKANKKANIKVNKKANKKAAILMLAGAMTSASAASWAAEPAPSTAQTPIKHLVVLVLQDQSFDRYFGAYPNVKNAAGDTQFHAKANTPHVDGFTRYLLRHNPNLSNPYRMAPHEPTCDLGYGVYAQKHSYNDGRNNMFIWKDYDTSSGINDDGCFPQSVMGYYDGNAVTGLWNYAQHYAMADHLFASDYTTQAGGMIDLIAGTSKGVLPKKSPGVSFQDLLIQNNPPKFDDDSQGRFKVSMQRQNIGDLLNQHNVTWGYFSGGFTPSARTKQGKAQFHARSMNSQGSLVSDYNPINEPFQYFSTTANPHHLSPSAPEMIGQSDRAHHQYGLADFATVLKAGRLPAVSFVAPKSGQSGRVGVSSPDDEQTFIVTTVNKIMQSPEWKSTAVALVWSYSDGWYDHVTPPSAPKSMAGTGYGPRLPFVMISPWSKRNYVEHKNLDQSSLLKFIEYNWQLGHLASDSPDRFAHSLRSMFNFQQSPHVTPLILSSSNGSVKEKG